MMTIPSGIRSAGMVVVVSLVVAGIPALGSPQSFYLMIAIAMVLEMAAILFLREEENNRTAGE
jgi:hypothetical protein